MAVDGSVHGWFSTMKETRFSKYKPLRLSLDPNQRYSPATIAQYGFEVGALHLCESNKPEQLLRQRARIATALYRRNNADQFPEEGDGTIEIRRQVYTAWYGWRWQGLESADLAMAMIYCRIKPTLDSMLPGVSYSFRNLALIWGDLLRDPAPYNWRRNKLDWAMRWYDIQDLLMETSLIHHANALGLNLKREYKAIVWRQKP